MRGGDGASEAEPGGDAGTAGRPRLTVRLFLTVLGPAIGFSVTAVDPLMLNLNLPQVARALAVPPEHLGLLGGAATLVMAAVVLAVGGLGDVHGLKRLLLLGLTIGLVANVLAAFSPGYRFLLAMRFLDGPALAALLGLSLALLTVSVPPGTRPVAVGVFLATDMFLYGVTPAAGGWVVQTLGWRWLFSVAPLLELLALVLTARYVPRPPGRNGGRLDGAGVALFGAALLGFVYGVGEAQKGIGRPAAWLPLTAGAVAVAAFVRRERRIPEPALDPGLFRRPAFTVAALAALTLNFLAAGFGVVLGQFGGQVLALPARTIGLLYLPGTLLLTAAGVLAGRMVARYTPRPVMVTGLLLFVASGVVMALTASPAMTLWFLVLATWLGNLGIAVTSTPACDTILAHAPPGKSGVVASVQPASGMTGYALGPPVYLLLLDLFFRRRWLADAGTRGLSVSRARHAVDAVTSAMAANPGTPGYDPDLVRLAAGLSLRLDYSVGLRLTMLTVSLVPLVLAVVAWLLLPRRQRPER